MSRDLGHVLDMLRAATRVRTFMDGVAEASFLADIEKQSSVLYQLSVIGEAARRVSREFQAEHPDIDWASIISFRNRIVHGYDDVDLDTVWMIIRDDVPRAIAALTPLAPEDPRGTR